MPSTMHFGTMASRTAVGAAASKAQQNYINHIALVLDDSGSMAKHRASVIKVADAQIAHLAQRSKELDQETRVTVYTFGERNKLRCVIYDKDVLRLPSIRDAYNAHDGETALIDATLKALDDMAKTPEIYGDHAFLVYVLTDGLENVRPSGGPELNKRIAGLADNWTVAVFVPDIIGKREARNYGFPADNIAIWDASDVRGMERVGEAVRQTTESFMSMRSAGVRGTRKLFELNQVTTAEVKSAGLDSLHPGQYRTFDVTEKIAIAPFVEAKTRRAYVAGEAFFQLTKSEIVGASKELAIFDKKSSKLYVGANARKLLGLPDAEIRIAPSHNPDHTVYIQSTSVNRWLMPNTRLLLINRK